MKRGHVAVLPSFSSLLRFGCGGGCDGLYCFPPCCVFFRGVLLVAALCRFVSCCAFTNNPTLSSLVFSVLYSGIASHGKQQFHTTVCKCAVVATTSPTVACNRYWGARGIDFFYVFWVRGRYDLVLIPNPECNRVLDPNRTRWVQKKVNPKLILSFIAIMLTRP